MELFSRNFDISGMSVEDRVALAEMLWDSVATGSGGPSLTEAQRAELDSRLAAVKEGKLATVPWAEVQRRLDALCPE